MLKICGTIMKNNKIIRDIIVTSDINKSYQENLKQCIIEICNKFDISKPYWLPMNLKEYNKKNKTSFNQNNFIDTIDFDKLIIQEIKNKH